jgi:ketosteroid isomerase-like protein
MPPNDPANVGTANIQAWSAGMLGAFNAEFALDVDETSWPATAGRSSAGAYNITLTPKTGGQSIRDTGKYITIYSRGSDGRWLIARDIWNSNNQSSPHN